MEELLQKLKVFLAMEQELPFAEFREFYMELIGVLMSGFETMDNDSRVQGRYICQIVGSNARARAGTSRDLSKKFRKMAEKCDFWAEAIDYRLGKEGLDKSQIEEMTTAVEKVMEAGTPAKPVDKPVETLDKPVEMPGGSVETLSGPGEKPGRSGEKPGGSGEKPDGSGEKPGGSGGNLNESGEPSGES